MATDAGRSAGLGAGLERRPVGGRGGRGVRSPEMARRIGSYYIPSDRMPRFGAAMSNAAITDFKIGDILVRGFEILGRNAATFGTLAVLFMLVPFGAGLMIRTGLEIESGVSAIAFSALVVLWILLYFLLFATLTHGTIRDLRGTPARIGESLKWGLGRLFPVIGITIVATIGTGLGTILLFVPGLMLMTMWWVAVPVTVVERIGVLASLRRSAELTRGYRWRVFGVIAVVYLGQIVLEMLTNFILAGAPIFRHFASFMITVAATAYFAVVTAVCYHDLRVLKDGVGVDEIASVFD